MCRRFVPVALHVVGVREDRHDADGYIDKADLDGALKSASAPSVGATTDSGPLFGALDSNGDGKITESELGAGIRNRNEAMSYARANGLEAPPAGRGHGAPEASKSHESDPLAQLLSLLTRYGVTEDTSSIN